jgi:hypothetical protein
MNLKLDFDLKKILPVLLKLEPYIFGLALIGVFGFTAYVVNVALNVKPTEVVGAPAGGATTGAGATAGASSRISFDKPTIEALKKLEVVEGTLPSSDIGRDNPFR